jgi:Flp pilus assembly protein TadD
MKGDHGKAIADYTEAIRLYPKSAKPYHARGLVYKRIGETAKAEADFAQAKKLGYKDKEQRR